jgi:alcohol dehydrogenase
MGRLALFRGVGRPIEHLACEVTYPEGAEVLVRVTACTICGSDRHSFLGLRSTPVPSILGHEILGTIAAFGPEASRCDASGAAIEVGDRVTWSLVASCGTCFFCARSLPQKCRHLRKYGHESWHGPRDWNGGLAEYCLLHPGTAIVRVPDSLPDAVACPASCATATVAAALAAAGELASSRAVVLGAGMLGVTAVAWLRAEGADEVIVCDRLPDRLALAESFGATRVVSPGHLADAVAAATDGLGADLVLEMSGAQEAVVSGLGLVRTGGTLVLVGSVFPTQLIPLAPEAVVRRCLHIVGVHNYAPCHLTRALTFLASQSADRFASLVSDWLPLSEAERALREPAPPPALRVGVRPIGGNVRHIA